MDVVKWAAVCTGYFQKAGREIATPSRNPCIWLAILEIGLVFSHLDLTSQGRHGQLNFTCSPERI